MLKLIRKFIVLYPIPSFAIFVFLVGSILHFLNLDNIRVWMFAGTIIACGLPNLYKIITSIKERSFGIDIIAIIGIYGSLFVSEYTAGLILIIMLTGGEALEDYAEGKAKSFLETLVDLTPKRAHKKINNKLEIVSVESLQINDEIVVKSGEVVPIDGVVIDGETDVDESTLTGESLPVPKVLNDDILSGSVVLSGAVTLRVTKYFKDSAFSQIVHLVEKVENQKAPFVKLTARYGGYFTPIVLVFALIVYFWTRDLRIVYAVFAAASPCPLLIAAPIAFIAGVARIAKLGVVVKSGAVLERLATFDSIVFDKTGTITKGELVLTDVLLYKDSMSRVDALSYASSIGLYSGHLVAKSFSRIGDLKNFLVKDFVEIYGKGISGVIDGKKVLLGNVALLSESLVDTSAYKDVGDGVVSSHLAIDGVLVASFYFADEVRHDATKFVSAMRKNAQGGIVLATGDKEETAKKIASLVLIDDVRWGCTPTDKVNIVESLINNNKKPLLIGDGVNDAAAMKRAYTSIAVGTYGSNIATESSDVVVPGNDIYKIVEAVKLAKGSLRVAKQSVVLGMSVTSIVMVLAAFSFVSPVYAAASQELIDLVSILWSLRVLSIRVS